MNLALVSAGSCSPAGPPFPCPSRKLKPRQVFNKGGEMMRLLFWCPLQPLLWATSQEHVKTAFYPSSSSSPPPPTESASLAADPRKEHFREIPSWHWAEGPAHSSQGTGAERRLVHTRQWRVAGRRRQRAGTGTEGGGGHTHSTSEWGPAVCKILARKQLWNSQPMLLAKPMLNGGREREGVRDGGGRERGKKARKGKGGRDGRVCWPHHFSVF